MDGHLVPKWINSVSRVLSRWVNKTDDCWIWTGYVMHKGYGTVNIAGKCRRAHIVIYEHFKGSVPDGMQLDHLCRNRACVNPYHLEAVTQAENMRRGRSPSALNALKVVCMRGHALTGTNLYVNPAGERQCKTCRVAATKAWRAKKSA